MGTFKKKHLKFYGICFLFGLVISFVTKGSSELFGIVPFLIGLLICFMSIIGIIFFCKGDE